MSDAYIIHPEDYQLPYPPLTAFIRANGLNERDISADYPLIVKNGTLTVTEFVFKIGPNGERIKQFIGPERETLMKREVTVPLVSGPEEHGLQRSVQNYVDLRFHFEEKQDFPDEAPYMELSRVTRHGQHYMPDEVLERMEEDFAQSDSWQEFFCHDVPSVLSSGEAAEPR